MITMKPEDDRLAALARASRFYRDGCDAAKRLRKWMPGGTYEVSQKLAKALLPKFAKAAKEANHEFMARNSAQQGEGNNDDLDSAEGKKDK